MWLFWLIFLISKAKLTTGSLFLLKLIKLRREQDVNLDQIGVKSNFRFNSKEHDGSFLGKSFKTFFTANTPVMKWLAYHNQIQAGKKSTELILDPATLQMFIPAHV